MYVLYLFCFNICVLFCRIINRLIYATDTSAHMINSIGSAEIAKNAINPQDPDSAIDGDVLEMMIDPHVHPHVHIHVHPDPQSDITAINQSLLARLNFMINGRLFSKYPLAGHNGHTSISISIDFINEFNFN